MTLPRERRFAGVLALHKGQVILVRECHERWGGEFWNVPSGRVEAHETPAEGAARELAEETGEFKIPTSSCKKRAGSQSTKRLRACASCPTALSQNQQSRP